MTPAENTGKCHYACPTPFTYHSRLEIREWGKNSTQKREGERTEKRQKGGQSGEKEEVIRNKNGENEEQTESEHALNFTALESSCSMTMHYVLTPFTIR